MAFGWLKALQLGYSLYKTGTTVAPLLRRQAAAARTPDQDQALSDLTTTVRLLAAAADENQRALRVVRAASIGSLAVSVVTLILVIAHIANA